MDLDIFAKYGRLILTIEIYHNIITNVPVNLLIFLQKHARQQNKPLTHNNSIVKKGMMMNAGKR